MLCAGAKPVAEYYRGGFGADDATSNNHIFLMMWDAMDQRASY
jgi:hypothetical protein